jgi:hypothetical protein
LSERQTVWLQVIPEQTMTEFLQLLEPLYESGLLTPPIPSDAEPISGADFAAMVESIHVAGQPLSETIIEGKPNFASISSPFRYLVSKLLSAKMRVKDVAKTVDTLI